MRQRGRIEILPGRFGRQRISIGWSRVVALGWALMAVCLACVGASSQIIGRPVWWADDERWSTPLVTFLVLLVFGLATAVAIWAFVHGPFVPHVSLGASLLLAMSAIADRHSSPGSAVVTGALAFSASMLSIGAFSGRKAQPAASERASSSTTSR